MMLDVIKQQIAEGEGQHTEFLAQGDPARVAELVCGFLNAQGGTIFCGLAEDGTVLGVPDAPDTQVLLHQQCVPRISPAALFTISVDEVGGAQVLSIEVPEGKDRPYVCDGRVYVRQGSANVVADAALLRDMVQSKAVTMDRWERRPSMALEAPDLDRAEIRALVSEAMNAGRFLFKAPQDDDAVLAELGLSGSRGYTQAADVLLALNPAVRHPQVRVRVTRFADGKTGSHYLDDRQFQGPLVQVFNKVYGWISDYLPREERFEPGQVQRVASAPYPAEAIREGLVNAFAHRDYAGFSGGLTVGIHDDRIEIWNAGRLPDGLTPGNLRRNHPSLPTNPDMAQVLYLRGLMERIGRGTQKILQACEAQGLRPPQWEDRATGVTLTLFGPTAEDVRVQLNDRQRAVMATLSHGELVSLRPLDYRARFAQDISERQARRDLDALEKLGLLRREGAGPSTVFVLATQT